MNTQVDSLPHSTTKEDENPPIFNNLTLYVKSGYATHAQLQIGTQVLLEKVSGMLAMGIKVNTAFVDALTAFVSQVDAASGTTSSVRVVDDNINLSAIQDILGEETDTPVQLLILRSISPDTVVALEAAGAVFVSNFECDSGDPNVYLAKVANTYRAMHPQGGSPFPVVCLLPFAFATKAHATAISQLAYEINVVSNAAGELYGHTFMYTNSTVFTWLVLGKNPDGTERRYIVVDPEEEDYATHSERMVKLDAAFADLDAQGLSGAEYAARADVIRSTLCRRVNTVIASPICSFPQIAYKKEQIESILSTVRNLCTPKKHLYAKTPSELDAVRLSLESNPHTARYASDPAAWIEVEKQRVEESRKALLGDLYTELPDSWNPKWGNEGPDLTPAEYHPPEQAVIVITLSYVRMPKAGDNTDFHTLVCNGAPKVADKDLQAVFSKYNTETRTSVKTVNGTQYTVAYPEIRVVPDRRHTDGEKFNIYVTFSNLGGPSATDAAFALQMCRKVNIRTEKGELTTLVFRHWRTDSSESSRLPSRSYHTGGIGGRGRGGYHGSDRGAEQRQGGGEQRSTNQSGRGGTRGGYQGGRGGTQQGGDRQVPRTGGLPPPRQPSTPATGLPPPRQSPAGLPPPRQSPAPTALPVASVPATIHVAAPSPHPNAWGKPALPVATPQRGGLSVAPPPRASPAGLPVASPAAQDNGWSTAGGKSRNTKGISSLPPKRK